MLKPRLELLSIIASVEDPAQVATALEPVVHMAAAAQDAAVQDAVVSRGIGLALPLVSAAPAAAPAAVPVVAALAAAPVLPALVQAAAAMVGWSLNLRPARWPH